MTNVRQRSLGVLRKPLMLRLRTFAGLTLRVKLCGRGPRAEADAARRLPHVTWRVCGRRAAVILVS
jgi:hypothetical protein